MDSNERCSVNIDTIPKDQNEALSRLLPLLDLDSRALRRISKFRFHRGWAAISFLFAGLHPDGALERSEISNDAEDFPLITSVEPRLIRPYYAISGWPVILVPVAVEAWRRYENGDLGDEEFYCSDAQLEGMRHRNPILFELSA